MWIPHVLPLLRKYRFILPDFRGFGKSHMVPYAHKDVVRNHAEDVEDLLKALVPKERVILAGLSMGALTGLAFAERGGFSRVRGYVHIDQAPRIFNDAGYTFGLFGDRQDAQLAHLGSLLQASEQVAHLPFASVPEDLAFEVRKAFAEFFGSAFRPAWLKRVVGNVRHKVIASNVLPLSNWNAYMDCLRAYMEQRYDFSDALSKLDTPVHVMVGEASELYPAAGQHLFAQSLKRAHVHSFQNTGHAIPFERPLMFQKKFQSALESICRSEA